MSAAITVLGAGPAGLSTAYSLAKGGQPVTVLEPTAHLGGLARSENYCGYCVDLATGGFVMQPAQTSDAAWTLWQALTANNSRLVEVRSLLHYHYRLFKHPASFTNAVKHIGPIDFSFSGLSYLTTWLSAQQTQSTELLTAKDWTTERFGKHLTRIFFEPYLQQLWGLPADQLTQAHGKYCSDRTLLQEAWSAICGRQTAQTVDYPKQGMGSVWKNCSAAIEQLGSTVSVQAEVVSIEHRDGWVKSVSVVEGGRILTHPVSQLISTLPLPKLVQALNAPDAIVKAADRLRYRHAITVALVIDQASLFDEQWIDVHQPNVRVIRIQNYKNWSVDMAPDVERTCLGLSYLCDSDDDVWKMDDTTLIELASAELIELGLIFEPDLIRSGQVIRAPQAYPVQTVQDLEPLGLIQDYLSRFENLQSIGNMGTHQLNGLAEEMACGIAAADTALSQQPSQQLVQQSERSQPANAMLQSLRHSL